MCSRRIRRSTGFWFEQKTCCDYKCSLSNLEVSGVLIREKDLLYLNYIFHILCPRYCECNLESLLFTKPIQANIVHELFRDAYFLYCQFGPHMFLYVFISFTYVFISFIQDLYGRLSCEECSIVDGALSCEGGP